MSHEFESGFFTQVPAWHRLGTVVQEAPSVDDAIRLAGLDWRVTKRNVLRDDGLLVPGYKALVRSSDSSTLAIVSDKFQPLQNADAFRFFNPVLASGHATLEAAGSLKGGRHVWVLAKLRGASADVVPGDRVDGYLLLSNSHDGSRAVRVQFTSIRVVCWNTLSAAHERGDAKGESCLRVLHSGNVTGSLEAIQEMLDLTGRTFRCSVEAYQALARKQITIDGLREYVAEVFQLTEEEARNSRVIGRVQSLFDAGIGGTIPGVRGTYWAAYNAVTEYVGHQRGKNEDTRLDSTWFGTGKNIADRALASALAAVN